MLVPVWAVSQQSGFAKTKSHLVLRTATTLAFGVRVWPLSGSYFALFDKHWRTRAGSALSLDEIARTIVGAEDPVAPNRY